MLSQITKCSLHKLQTVGKMTPVGGKKSNGKMAHGVQKTKLKPPTEMLFQQLREEDVAAVKEKGKERKARAAEKARKVRSLKYNDKLVSVSFG